MAYFQKTALKAATSIMRGFTLLEVLLSIACIAIIGAISTPVYYSFAARNELDTAVVTTARTLRRAQTLAKAVDGDMNWGVYIKSGSITLFQGPNYAGRNTAFDETFNVPTSITTPVIQEIVFSKFSGLPETTGTLTFTSSSGETNAVTINTKGMVSY